jgi:hypothetical protein
MSSKLFITLIFLVSAIVFLILNAFVSTSYEVGIIAAACALAVGHVMAGFFMSRWALHRPNKQFMTIIMGGIGVRLLGVAVILVLLVPVIRESLQLFIITFAVYYIFFQIIEIFFIHRGLQARRMNPSGM